MSEVVFLLHFPGKDAFYVSRWWKGHACHLSSSSSVMERWWVLEAQGNIEKEFMVCKLSKNDLPKQRSSPFQFSGVCSRSHLSQSFLATRDESMGVFWASLELPKHNLFAFHCREPVLCKDSTQTVPEGCLETSKPSSGKTTGEISRPFVVPQGEALPGAVPDRALLYSCLLNPAHCPQA